MLFIFADEEEETSSTILENKSTLELNLATSNYEILNFDSIIKQLDLVRKGHNSKELDLKKLLGLLTSILFKVPPELWADTFTASGRTRLGFYNV